MDEKPESIWKKPLKLPGLLMVWLALCLVTMLVFSIVILMMGDAFSKTSDFAGLLIFGAIVATILLCLWLFIRWIFCWRNFKRFLFGLACFATLIALFYVEEDWRGKHDWEKFKREWEAKGEHFDFASVIPPAVPDDQNFAMAPIWVDSIKFEYGTNVARQWYGVAMTEAERAKLVDRLDISIYASADRYNSDSPHAGNWAEGKATDLKIWQKYYRDLAAKTNEFPVAPQPQTPAQDVLLALGKYDSAIAELQTASRLPYSRFPVFSNADHPFDTLLPHLAMFKRCAKFLQLRALAELQNSQSDKSADDVKLNIELTEKFRNEPFLISHLVRIAMLQIALQPIYEGLANHQWSDAQLAELDAQLAKLDFLADYERSIRGERAAGVSALDYMRRASDMTEIQGGDERHHPFNLGSLMPGAFFYQSELNIARMYQQYDLPMVDLEKGTVSPARVRDLQTEATRDLSHHSWPYKILARMLFPAIENAVKKLACAQSATDLARTAIALERYRLAHGEFPESLDALAPQFMEKIPHDVIGGQPLKYRRTNDGQFVLYSVGWNEKDDGGVVVYKKGSAPEVDRDKGDWVWRYPQK